MIYEDVTMQAGETVLDVITAYGHDSTALGKIWLDPKNASLSSKRGGNWTAVQAGDVIYVPIPWVMTVNSLTPVDAIGTNGGANILASRTGQNGTRVHWLQTVYQSNQPIGSTDVACADACPPDDNLPFYWTNAEYSAKPTYRKEFYDAPRRSAPAKKSGTTSWRAILSLGVATGKRVSIVASKVWGFDLTVAGKASTVGPRDPTRTETSGHLAILYNGKGTGAITFGTDGWAFRKLP